MATSASEDEHSSSLLAPRPKGRFKTKRQLQKEKEEAERLALLEAEKCSDDELQDVEEVHCIQHGNRRQRHRHGMKYTMYAARFSPDGRYLATSASDKMVCLWELGTEQGRFGREMATYEHQDYARCVTFSNDGTHICTGCDDKKARIWSVQDRTDVIPEAEVERHLDHADWVVCACYSPDGAMLCTVSRRAEVFIHSLVLQRHGSKERHGSKHRTGSKERQGSKERHASKERDPSKMTAAESETSTKKGSKRRASSKEPTFGESRKLYHEDQTWAAVFSSDSELLVTASGWEEGHALVFDVASLDEVLRIHQPDWVTSVDLRPGDNGLPLVLTTGRDRTVRIWELPEQMLYGKELQDSKDEKERLEQERKAAEAGKKKLVMSKKKQKELAEAAERAALQTKLEAKELKQFGHHLNHSVAAAFSPDGKRICTACDAGAIYIYDVETAEQLVRLDQPEGVADVSFMPNGRKICVASQDASARIYGGIRNLWMENPYKAERAKAEAAKAEAEAKAEARKAKAAAALDEESPP